MNIGHSYDYIVVGAGAAGSVLAARLSENPDRTVLLLEAGPRDTDPRIWRPASWPALLGSALDWGYRTTAQAELNGRCLSWPRGRVVGGSAAINAMVHIRGAATDFDSWQRWGGESWSARAMLPYLERLETPAASGGYGWLPVAENTAPHPFAAAFVQAGQKFGLPYDPDLGVERPDSVGLYRTTRTSAPARRANTARTYLRPALERPNLTLVTDAPVGGIVTRGGRAIGVRVGATVIGCEGEIVLCAGTVASPQLLLASGIGPTEQLRALDIPSIHPLAGVGENLHDHLQVSLVFDTVCGHPVSERSNLGEAGGFVTLYPHSPAPDIQLSFAPMKDLNNAAWLGYGFTIGPAVTRPRSRGRLTLASSDVDIPPRIDPGYLTHHDDLDVLVEGVRIALDIAATEPLAGLRSGPAPLPSSPTRTEVEAFVRANAQTQFHPVGTCRLGTDSDAVVDTRLRVHGLRGLRVADASIMPTMITGNIHSTVAAIAERAAEFLREDAG
ncbi:GMC family oxidoreductase [Nocardia sp. NPDC088792]|uniref:GMC family oxidoreductase n=1 Tax=Nocardia sp. NPDC088792 TaxID=3364332 RepID=UPI0037FCB6A9